MIPIMALIFWKPVTPLKPAPHGMRQCVPQLPIKRKFKLCFDATLSEDPDLASQADVRFHLAIAEASHNVVLLQTMRGFFDVLHSSVKQSRQRMYLVPPVFSQLTEQHQAVMEAIFAGDADGARKAMMAHLSFVHTTMKRFDEDQARHARITRLPGDHNEHFEGEQTHDYFRSQRLSRRSATHSAAVPVPLYGWWRIF